MDTGLFEGLDDLIEFIGLGIAYIHPHPSTIFQIYGAGITPVKFASLHTIVYFTGQALIGKAILQYRFVFDLRKSVHEKFDEINKIWSGQGGHLLLTIPKLEISHFLWCKYPSIKI